MDTPGFTDWQKLTFINSLLDTVPSWEVTMYNGRKGRMAKENQRNTCFQYDDDEDDYVDIQGSIQIIPI